MQPARGRVTMSAGQEEQPPPLQRPLPTPPTPEALAIIKTRYGSHQTTNAACSNHLQHLKHPHNVQASKEQAFFGSFEYHQGMSFISPMFNCFVPVIPGSSVILRNIFILTLSRVRSLRVTFCSLRSEICRFMSISRRTC